MSAVLFIQDMYTLYLLYYKHRSNFLFYNIYQLAETMVLYYFLRNVINNSIARRVIPFFGLIYIAIWILSYLKFGDKSYFSSCTNFENMTVLVCTLYYYYKQITNTNSAFIYADTAFWTVTAFFISAAGTFFLYLYIASLSLEEKGKYYLLNYIFTIIRTFFLSVAIFIKPGTNNYDTHKYV